MNKRILITGGSRGLGLALCRRFLRDGDQVVTTARSLSSELQSLLENYPAQASFVAADLADSRAVGELAKAARLLEGVDGFVSNAAIGLEGMLTLNRIEDIEHCVRVNLISTLLLTREVIKGMLTRGGSVVFVSSVAARTGLSGLSVYAATKGALLAFSRSLAREYGERKLRCNCVLPGYFASEMTTGMPPEAREKICRRTALSRLGEVEDVVGMVCFLMSDASRHITGAEFVVDGGFSI